jgi:hypothetical protein
VPVTVTVNVPAVFPVQLTLDDPAPAMLVGLSVHVSPVLGEIEEARETVPLNPLTALTVMVDVPVEPAFVVTMVGLAVIVKSGVAVFHMYVAERMSEVLPPMTIEFCGMEES